ncbi:MAG: hypothetical protein WC736_04135 [Gallionella sp.]
MRKLVLSVWMSLVLLSAYADEGDLTDAGTQTKTPAPVGIAPTVRMSGVPPPAQIAVPIGESPLQGKSSITFMDSKLFDMKLSRELEAGRDMVEVDVSGRVPLSNIPPRIDKWVVRSAEEGKVELLPSEQAPKTRAIFGFIPMIFNAFGSLKNMQEERMVDQVRRYDTKIYYKKDEAGETLIYKIVLIRRK